MMRVYQDTMLGVFKLNSELTGLESLQKEQNEELRRLNSALDALSAKAAEFAKLKRILAQASLNSETYAKKTVEERISAESNAAKFSIVKIVQRAHAPLRPISPSYRFIAALALIAGMVGAVAAALGVEAFSRLGTDIPNVLPTARLVPDTDREVALNHDAPLKRRQRSRAANSGSAAKRERGPTLVVGNQ
jgi:hypothetical protein